MSPEDAAFFDECCRPMHSFLVMVADKVSYSLCRSENIAQAMAVRGFQGPSEHRLHMMNVNETSAVANVLALLLLASFCSLIFVYL